MVSGSSRPPRPASRRGAGCRSGRRSSPCRRRRARSRRSSAGAPSSGALALLAVAGGALLGEEPRAPRGRGLGSSLRPEQRQHVLRDVARSRLGQHAVAPKRGISLNRASGRAAADAVRMVVLDGVERAAPDPGVVGEGRVEALAGAAAPWQGASCRRTRRRPPASAKLSELRILRDLSSDGRARCAPVLRPRALRWRPCARPARAAGWRRAGRRSSR